MIKNVKLLKKIFKNAQIDINKLYYHKNNKETLLNK